MRSPRSPSPSPKKRKKDKRKKEKKKKRHKDKRSKHRKKRERRSRSPSTSSGDEGIDTSARAVASPSKHRSGVTVVESPRDEAPGSVSNSGTSLLALPARPHSHAAKLMAAAEQKRRIEGPNAGKIMSKAERMDKQRAAAQTERRREPADGPRYEQASDRSMESAAEQPKRSSGSAGAATASQPFGNFLPRSLRRSGTNEKQASGVSGRMSDRPACLLKEKRTSCSDATDGIPGPASAAPVTTRSEQHTTTVTTKLLKNQQPLVQAQAGHRAPTDCVTCCECEDQPADVHCIQCDESFCRPCWGGQHRRGKRSLHKLQPILGEVLERAHQPAEPSVHHAVEVGGAQLNHSGMACEPAGDATQDLGAAGSIGPALPPGGMAALYSNDSERRLKTNRERVRWLPLRLTEEERTLLALLQGALHHSEYTDKVDVFSHSEKVQRQLHEMTDYMQTQCGLQLANSFKAGQRLVQSKLRANQDFFARAFEVGRRYKVMNPQKMRSDYGKMMYLLMDSQRPEVAEILQINLVKPIHTVGQLLQAKHGEGILASEDLDDATRDLSNDTHDSTQLLLLQQQKREAIGRILDKYSTKDLSRDEITRVLDSISDANNFLANNEQPVTRMLELLKTNFDNAGPKGNVKGGDFSLAIGRGNNFRSGGNFFHGGYKKFTVHSMGGSNSGGAKLTHSHSTQFTFTSQTFMLWQQVSKHMYSEYACCHSLCLNSCVQQCSCPRIRADASIFALQGCDLACRSPCNTNASFSSAAVQSSGSKQTMTCCTTRIGYRTQGRASIACSSVR